MDKEQFEHMFIASIVLERWKIIAEEIEHIKHHHTLVENALKHESERVDEEIWKAIDEIPNEDLKQDTFEEFGSIRFEAEHMYPNMHRSTMILTLFAYLECTLFYYCSSIKKYVLPDSSTVPRGSVLKYKKWLEESAGVELIDMEIEWNEINDLRILRNSIVHSYGSVEIDSQVEKVVLSNDFIDFCESEVGMGPCHGSIGGFTIDEKYFDHIVQTLKTFFEKLSSCIEPVFGVDEETAKQMYEKHFDDCMGDGSED